MKISSQNEIKSSRKKNNRHAFKSSTTLIYTVGMVHCTILYQKLTVRYIVRAAE